MLMMELIPFPLFQCSIEFFLKNIIHPMNSIRHDILLIIALLNILVSYVKTFMNSILSCT